MSTLKLNSMKCEKLQDSISEDEIEVRIGGVKVAGPIGVHKGERVTFGPITRTFTGSVSVQLVELDANSAEDNLGVRTVNSSPLTGQTLVFNAANHAYYTVNYTVT